VEEEIFHPEEGVKIQSRSDQKVDTQQERNSAKL